MKFVFRPLLAAAFVAAFLGLCATAGAAPITLGPSLSGSWISVNCEDPVCVNSNFELGGTGTYVTSPVNGAVIGFNVIGGETGTSPATHLDPGERIAGDRPVQKSERFRRGGAERRASRSDRPRGRPSDRGARSRSATTGGA